MFYFSENSRLWGEFQHFPSAIPILKAKHSYLQQTQTRRQDQVDYNYGFSKRRVTASSNISGTFNCPDCGKSYLYKKTMSRHIRLECGKEPQFHCPNCPYRAKQKNHLVKHIASRHKESP